MNRTLFSALALVSAVAVSPLAAQTTAASAPAAPAAASAAPAVTPQAVPAKIAVIAFEQAVQATNEFQRSVAEIQKKYEPQKTKIEGEGAEVDTLRKQVQALPANTPDEDRANRLKVLDTKEKQLQRDSEDAQNAFNGDLQEAFGKVAQKVGNTAVKYAQENGFTLMLNDAASGQTPNPVLWAAPTTDISQAVVNAYNASSGIAAPPPSAPSPTRRPTPAGSAPTTPRKNP